MRPSNGVWQEPLRNRPQTVPRRARDDRPNGVFFMLKRRSFLALGTVSALAFGAPAVAQSPSNAVRASSPGGVLTIEMATDNDGRPTYSVSRLGRKVVDTSWLGFLLTDAPKLERNFDPDGDRAGHGRRDLGAALGRAPLRPQPLQRAARRLRREDWRCAAASTWSSACSTTASASATNFPSRPQLTTVNIGEELTEFTIAEPATAWWIPGRRVEPLRIPLQQDAARRGGPGAHADHDAHRRRPAHRDSRGRAGRLLRRCGCAASRACKLPRMLSPSSTRPPRCAQAPFAHARGARCRSADSAAGSGRCPT